MRNKALRTAGIVLMIFSAGFICYRLAKLDYSGIIIDFSVSSVAFLVLSLVLQIISVLALGILFSLNVGKGKEGQKVPVREVLLVYCRANLGKYIPGNVFQYFERNLFFSSYGVSHLDTVLASVLEILCLIVGAFVLSAVFGKFDIIREAINNYGYIIPAVCVLGVFFLIVMVCIIHKKKKILRTIAKRFGERGGIKLLISDILCYVLVLLVMGTVMLLSYFAISSPGELPLEPGSLFGAYIAAWLCGFVIIGAPGGIGVREAVFSLIYINTPYLDTVLALSLLVRVISIVADVLAYVISRIIVGKKA
ncbi:MAG: hypothetical protein K6F44_08345 [Lachnospiraceae bacterium]|nr:hypothetical protein [Lachnospiraceae bacterium]